MNLDFELKDRREGVLVIALRGSLICCREVTQLHALLQQICARKAYHIVLDMAEVGRLDGFGVDYMALLRGMLRRRSTSLVLIHLEGQPKKIFSLSKLTHCVPVCANADDAFEYIRSQVNVHCTDSAAPEPALVEMETLLTGKTA